MRLLLRLVLWPWLLAALIVGRLECLARLPAWGLPGLVAGLAALTLVGVYGFRQPRAWSAALDLKRVVVVHGVRLYGIYLLALYARGELPYALVPGAWSDILVAVLAVGVALLPLRAGLRRHLLVIWNTVGVMGLLLVGIASTRVGLAQPWRLEPFYRLPLSLLPTFVLPLLLVTHVILYVRLRLEAPETARPA